MSLDNFIKEDIKEMREIVEKATIKKFNVISVVFLIELIVVAISAYGPRVTNGAPGQQVGRDAHRRRDPEAHKLAFRQVKGKFGLDFG